MTELPDPERAWEPPAAARRLDRAEVERRIGAVGEPLELLGGGLSNTSVRVGDRVLRIYRRDPSAAAVEAALLSRPWRSFRVPAVRQRGDDFLLLEYVPHTPVPAGVAQGAAVGRALAEIHAVSFAGAGFLDASLRVAEPFADIVGALRAHLVEQLDAADRALGPAAVAAFDERAGDLRAAAGAPVLVHADFKAANLRWTGAGELLVLDWEFAYAGAALSDVGQLLRWHPPRSFVRSFAAAYRDGGGALPGDWQRLAAVCDLVNLAGLLARSEPGSRRARDVVRRIRATAATGRRRRARPWRRRRRRPGRR